MHNARMEEYRKVLYSGLDVMDSEVAQEFATPAPKSMEDSVPSFYQAPVQEQVEVSIQSPSAAQRMAAYHAYPAPASRRNLFEGITLRNGELVTDVPAEEQVAPAPVAAAVVAPAAPAAPESDSEDARPTPRTMEVLNAKAKGEVAANQSFFASLSSKTKIILLTVAAAIVMVIVLICINTAILNSINADIEQKQIRVNELAQQAQRLQESIEEITDPESIRAWAESMGMTQG